MRRSLLLLTLALFGLVPSIPSALAQDATPVAYGRSGDRLDLAAMALPEADLPSGYVNVDERYFLAPEGVAGFFSQAATPADIAAIDLIAMYDSFYVNDADELLYLYIAQFPTPEAASAGFAVLEDETGEPADFDILSSVDYPAPVGLGDMPSETSVTVIDFRPVDGPLVDDLMISFRLDSFVVGVMHEIPIDAASATPAAVATPAGVDPQREVVLVDVANVLIDRISAVEAGETVTGVDQSLPTLLLPTDHAWPLPGVAAEGYKDPAQILGPDDNADAFVGGYSRTVAAGTTPADPFPTPPFVTIGVSRFASPEAAMAVLEHAGDLPTPGPLPSIDAWTAIDAVTIPEADEAAMFTGQFDSAGTPDSARVVFVTGEYLVTVDIMGALGEEEAVATARDLATQQAACLAAGGCDDVTVPSALAS